MKLIVDYSYTTTFIVRGEGNFKSKAEAKRLIREDPADVESSLCPSQGSSQLLKLSIHDVEKA